MNLNVCINDHTVGRGFFSFFNQVICALDYSDKMNEPLMVDFSRGEYNYGKWENYFKQPNNFYVSANGRFESVWFPSEMSAKFVLTPEDIKRGGELVRKYIFFSDDFNDYLYHGGAFLLGKNDINQNRVLGVHVRLTDHFLHGELLPIEYYLQQVRQRINGFTHVYLATDSIEAFNAFAHEFGNRLLYQKCERLHGHRAIQNTPGMDPIKIGREVLLDCINLSRCQYLLKTASNVTHAALFFNPELQYKNIDSHIEYK